MPAFLRGRVAHDTYRQWIWNRASWHARRDAGRGWQDACAHGYALMIRDAVMRCGGRDFYTRRWMNWEQLGELDMRRAKNDADYLLAFDDYPSIDHAKPGPPAEFEICGLWLNRAKGVQTWDDYLASTQELVAEQAAGGAVLADAAVRERAAARLAASDDEQRQQAWRLAERKRRQQEAERNAEKAASRAAFDRWLAQPTTTPGGPVARNRKGRRELERAQRGRRDRAARVSGSELRLSAVSSDGCCPPGRQGMLMQSAATPSRPCGIGSGRRTGACHPRLPQRCVRMPSGSSPSPSSHGSDTRAALSASGSPSGRAERPEPETEPVLESAPPNDDDHRHHHDHDDLSPDGIVPEVELPQLPGLTRQDVNIARSAVKARLINGDVARRALTALSGLRRRGEMVSIAAIFVSHRHMDAAAVRKLLIDLGHATLICPKAECGARFNLRDFPPAPVYTCRKCGAPLGYLGLDGDEGVEEGRPVPGARSRGKSSNSSSNLLPLPDVIKEQSSLLESDFDETTLLDTNRLRTLRDLTSQVEPDADLRADEAMDLPANQGHVSDPAATAAPSSSNRDGIRRDNDPVADAFIDMATDDIVAGRGSLVYALRITRGVKAEFDVPTDGTVRAVTTDDPNTALHRTPAHIRFGYEGALRPDADVPMAANQQQLLVRDRDVRRLVRMRLLQHSDVATNDEIEALLQEAQIAGQIEHPGVPPVYDVGLDSANRVYVIERLIDRQTTLSRLLKARRRSDDAAASRGRTTAGTQAMLAAPSTRYLFEVLLRVADVLACAHARGVEYRNLRPTNVVIGGFGTVYLTDWSQAHLRGRPEVNAERLIISGRMPGGRVVTLDGSLVPDPGYISPEQAAGELEQLGPPADVHGLGAIAYEIIAGAPPYVGPDGWAVLSALRTGRPIPLDRVRAARNVPAELRRVIMKSLARNPDDRHVDAVEFRRELRAALDASGLLGPREFQGSWWTRLVSAVTRLFRPSVASHDPFSG